MRCQDCGRTVVQRWQPDDSGGEVVRWTTMHTEESTCPVTGVEHEPED